MESTKISDQFSDLTDNVRRYIQLKIDLLKLSITEKLSSLFSLLLLMIVFFILFLFIFLFISIAFIFWYRDNGIGPAWAGALIVAGFYILIGIFVYLLRIKIFIDPVVAHLSRILLEDENENKE